MPGSAKFTIVFTDSGLGGLSSLALFYQFLRHSASSYKEIDLLFFNALPESGNGYGKMKSAAEKVQTFNSALQAIQQRYNPDIIAIACNTLSAIYPETPFAESSQNVIEIISCGRMQISQHFEKSNQEPLLILATPTTINSNAYKIENEKAVLLSGENLASLIEADFKDSRIKDRINEIFVSARKKMPDNNNISLFLGCTHYGYISSLFQKISQDYNFSISTIIDPQDAFIKKLKTKFQNNSVTGLDKPQINLRIESQAVIESNELDSISTLLDNDYPEISESLKNYHKLPKIF